MRWCGLPRPAPLPTSAGASGATAAPPTRRVLRPTAPTALDINDRLAFLVALLALLFPVRGLAGQQPAPTDTLRVGTRVAAPFVLEAGDGYAGLSIALWDHVAERLGLALRPRGA
jgi:ABC-type amino acid transport substrate-binding protein